MAVTYSTAAKVARQNAVVTQIGASGKLEIGTTGMAQVLATITLDATAGTVAGAGVLTLSGFPKSATAAAGGTAAAARIRTSANADVITGLTVGTTGSDINLDNLSIASGQQVNISSFVLTHTT